MKNKLILALWLTFLVSCSKESQDAVLSSVSYTGDELKINYGLYGRVTSDSTGLEVYFLYRNGHLIVGGYPNWEELEEFRRRGWPGYPGAGKTSYGIFEINDEGIIIEEYFRSNDGPLKTVVSSGTILNDSTFHIHSIENNFYDKTIDVDQTFKFYPFSPKPDSTNNYIE